MKDVLVSDGVAAAGAFVIEAGLLAYVGGALCPQCAIATVVGVGISAAYSSAVTYFSSSNCCFEMVELVV